MAASSRVPSRRRSGFTRRLAQWAGSGRRWTLQPLACAVMLLGHEAMAADVRLPQRIAEGATVKVRGKTFTWQPASQGSVLGNVVVKSKDANGNPTSVSQVLTQVVKRGLYNWQTFDIGRDATFEINMTGGEGSSALNRVVNSVNPSEILGALKSNGEVYLINRNGVLFGASAQVNVQGLIASTLDIDDNVFLNGLNTVDTPQATFAWDDVDGTGQTNMVTFDHPSNYVRVEKGAKITTPSGGRVFLIARKVENAGTIDTTSGQVALLAGSKVHIKGPDKEPMYASEVNDKIPALRGFLFEVDGNGEAVNLGDLISRRGNTTMMGYAVKQQGRIQATTSVSENGSVMLLARTDASTQDPGVGGSRTVASTAGTLELGANSSITITPDNDKAAAASVQMQSSRIELAGKTIDIGENALIRAPGATVNVRAEAVPDYNPVSTLAGYATQPNDPSARVVLRKGATIDVSGTTDTEASVAKHFVTTEFLRNADLSGNPYLKDGALINTKVTYDTRSAPAVLEASSQQSYLNRVTSTAGERMANAGTVTLASTGAVLMQGGSLVNVSGGKVTYTQAEVAPTQLKGADGKAYTLNTASTNVQIVGVSGQQAADATRFGNLTPNEASPVRMEAGYTRGGNGGVFQVQAQQLVMQGAVKADTIVGQRQATGQDARAKMASIRLGVGNLPSIRGGVTLSKLGGTADPILWANPLTADLPTRSDVSVAMLNESGAGQISINTEGGLSLVDGAVLRLAKGGELTVKSRGSQGIVLDGDIQGAGASVSLSTAASLDPLDAGVGGITLAKGRSINVAGDFVNKRRDGGAVADAVAGGQVNLQSGAGLDLQQGSSINVSGGATVSTSVVVTGTRAGAITLAANNAVARNGSTTVAQDFAAVQLNASLQGHSLAGSTSKAVGDPGDALSGKLAIKVGDVEIVKDQAGQGPLAAGRAADGIRLSSSFFNQGGFNQFDIEGVRQLDVRQGASVTPTPTQWVAKGNASAAATGSDLSTLVTAGALPQLQRPTVSVALKSRGAFDNASANALAYANGQLTLDEGSVVNAGPKGKVALTGGTSLVVNGAVRASGGQITTDLVGPDSTNTSVDDRFTGTYRIGAKAELDVSGSTLFSATVTAKRREGVVLNGGSIDLKLSTDGKVNTAVVIESGAQLKANGNSDLLDTSAFNAQGVYTRSRLATQSNGGTISVTADAAGALLGGTLEAKAGGAQARGGALNVTIKNDGSALTPTSSIVLQDALVTATQATRGEVTVSTEAVKNGGFQDLALSAKDQIETLGNVKLALPGTLLLDAPTLAARTAGEALLSAGSRLVRTNTLNVASQTQATGGAGSMTLSADVVDFLGKHNTQNIGSFNVVAGSEVRFTSVSPGVAGRFDTAADVTLTAPQVSVSTATDYTLDASGHKVTLNGGDASVAKPLSAGGHITINAGEIEQNGVLRAPFGQITLKADTITLGAGSETSVSGDGVSVPYGTTTDNGSKWTLNGAALDAPPEKLIELNAGTGSIDIQSNATQGQAKLDLSGGGQMLGWEFVSGPGGTKDVFQGSFDTGTFAIVPSVKGAAPMDAAILNDAGVTDLGRFNAMRQITFGAGGPVPAGTYTVLPARYALLAGGFLVRSTKVAPMALGRSVSLVNGSTLVGAAVGTRGGSLADAPAATYEVLTRQTALRYSEIKESSTDGHFSAQAKRLGVSAPRLAMDAGAVNLVANKMALQGALAFGKPAGGRGGEINIASDLIVVGKAPADVTGGLRLDAAQLNATGVDSLLLGGTRQTRRADGSRQVDVRATQVIVGTDAQQPLALADVALVAKQDVTVSDGAVIDASKFSISEPAQTLTVLGDGALVRVSADDTARTVRLSTGEQPIDRALGTVNVLGSSALIGGAVTVEATQATKISDEANVQAKQLTVGASRIAVGSGAAAVATDNTLVIGTALANRLARAERATLRSFEGIDFVGTAQLGGATQKALTLDTAQLNAVNREGKPATVAVVEAGTVTLTNTTGLSGQASSGDGSLSIKSTGAQGGDGHIHLRDGIASVAGASTTLDAAGSVVVHSGRTVTMKPKTTPDADGGAVVSSGSTASTTPTTGEVLTPTTPTTSEVLTSTANASGLQSGGALTVNAQSLALDAGALAQLGTQSGDFTLNAKPASGGIAAAVASQGGILQVQADGIAHHGVIDAPSGGVSLTARTGDVLLGGGSQVRADGRIWTVDGVQVATPGGTVKATSLNGNVTLAANASIDASAPAGVAGAQAGQVSLIAPKGEVKVDGAVRLLSDANQKGGSFVVDATTAPSVADLVSKLNLAAKPLVQGASERLNAAERFELHQRFGNVVIDADTMVKSRHIKMVADNGALDVQGQLNAGGAQAGSITLVATKDVTLGRDVQGAPTAQVLAASTGQGEAGGALTLASSEGTVSVLANSAIDLSGGAGASGGTLTLRAAQTQTKKVADGGVKVAPVAGTLTGVSSVVVQGVSTRNVDTLDAALLAKLLDANKNFLAAANTANTLSKVLNGKVAVGTRSMLQPAQVLNAAGDLTLDTDWNLSEFAKVGKAITVSNPVPMDLSIRATGKLTIGHSISSGFAGTNSKDGAPATVDDALKIKPVALITAGDGANINLVAGADALSADVMATSLDAKDTGHLVIGSESGDAVVVRTTTGSINMASAGDTTLLNPAATVYTTGRVATSAETPGLIGLFGTSGPKELPGGTTKQSPFLTGGGAVSLNVGGNLRQIGWSEEWPDGAPYVNQWTYIKGTDRGTVSNAYWTRYDQFNQGFATFGGGAINAMVGGDIRNLGFVTATSGYQPKAAEFVRFGGGDVSLQAGGNIAGVMVQAGGKHASIVAGQDIAATSERGALQYSFEDTQGLIVGRQGVQLGVVNDVGMMDSSRGDVDDKVVVTGLAKRSALRVQTVSGDVSQSAALPPGVNQVDVAQLWPNDVQVTAPLGNISIDTLFQAPTDGADLALLAQQNLSIGVLRVYADSPLGDVTKVLRSFTNIVSPLDTDLDPTRLEDAAHRSPVRLIGELGNVQVNASAKVDNPVRLIAGQDADIKELHVQHQTAQEMTLVRAGRDVNFPGSGNTTQDMLVKGPGDAIVMAGRDVNLLSPTGMQAIGNRENVALPEGSARLTVMAGVQADGSDFAQAERRYFHLLGGAGVADWASDLYAQLQALKAEQTLPGLGSDAAKAFAQASFTEQLAQARALVGQPAYEQAVLTHMQGREKGNPTLTVDQALAQLATLPAREHSVLLGKVLADTWSQSIGAEAQQATVLAMSQQRRQPYAEALKAYVQSRGVSAPVDTAQALNHFADSLSIEERLLFANQVLKAELTSAGRAALKQADPQAKLDLYQRGFNALETVFPGSQTTSNLLMGASNIKTLQNSDLTVLTPHGGMNVGRLSASADANAAATLGIVTTAGGAITGAVRDSIEVNLSRIFTVAQGDILLWASNGDIDAGKGAKTVLGAPPPLYRVVNGKIEVDTSGSFSGSGIAALDARSALDIYAPRGAINSGDAGIKSGGTLNAGAPKIIGGNDIKTGSGTTLAPPPVVGNGSTNVGALGQSATAAGPAADNGARSAKPSKRRLLLDLLGFGSDDRGDGQDDGNDAGKDKSRKTL